MNVHQDQIEICFSDRGYGLLAILGDDRGRTQTREHTKGDHAIGGIVLGEQDTHTGEVYRW